MIKKAVILCGGLATRMIPVTKTIPKEMLPIVNKPAIDYCIEDLKNNGITEILIVIGRNKECLENYYDKNIELEDRLIETKKTDLLKSVQSTYNDVNITFVRQINAKGTGYATMLAKNFVGNEAFILIFPDDIIIGESLTAQLLKTYRKCSTNVIPVRKIDLKDCNKYGMVGCHYDSLGLKITTIIEKPTPESSPSNISHTGGGLFTSEIFQYLKTCPTHSNGEIYLTDALLPLAEQGNLYGVETAGTRLDLGNPLGFIKANILAGLNDQTLKKDLKLFLKNLEY